MWYTRGWNKNASKLRKDPNISKLNNKKPKITTDLQYEY